MKYRTILLFGAPGAGKGTQGKILGTIPQFFHCACGDVFRNLRTDNELGRTFVEYSSRGELVPDDATVRLWRQHIDGNTRAGHFHPDRDTLVLDGIPRNVHQAEMLQETIDVRAIIKFVCPDKKKLIERLQRRALHENRLDDANLETIRSRLEIYERQTKPVLDFYGPSLVHTIDGTQSPVRVLRDILTVIVDTQPSSWTVNLVPLLPPNCFARSAIAPSPCGNISYSFCRLENCTNSAVLLVACRWVNGP